MTTPNRTDQTVEQIAHGARRAQPALSLLTGGERAALLREIAASIRSARGRILAANARDLEAGTELSDALRDRLSLDEERIEAMAAAVESIAGQSDPVGAVIDGRVLPNGIRLEKRRIPIGVVLMIYESRPNVTSDAAALCLKSGNAVVLKGGKEARASNRAIVEAIRVPLAGRGLGDVVGFVDTGDRGAVPTLLGMRGVIDLAIPRGGPGLMKAVTDVAKIPVVKHDAGNCHVYIDNHIDGIEEMCIRVILNAKTQRPGVCNAAETLLVHADVADRMVPLLLGALSEAGVEVRADERARGLFPGAQAATEQDWAEEYLALRIAVRVVDSLDDAASHIRTWGSSHTECIMTSSIASVNRFIALVDSASVAINCSTRFADGGEYGLGAEIGISTDRLHARGPMGAEDLTTYQWIMSGSGQVRE